MDVPHPAWATSRSRHTLELEEVVTHDRAARQIVATHEGPVVGVDDHAGEAGWRARAIADLQARPIHRSAAAASIRPCPYWASTPGAPMSRAVRSMRFSTAAALGAG